MQYNNGHQDVVMEPSHPAKIFLLSPALMTGLRAQQLISPRARSAAAQSFRSPQGVSIADAFSFMSCLYFRGKLAYATHFTSPPREWTDAGIYIIAPGFGLVPPDWTLSEERFRRLQRIPVDPDRRAYRRPLEDDAEALAERLGRLGGDTAVILLGSIATGKYVDPLWPVFQERLFFPRCFQGSGDMQRGALMLRAAYRGEELAYEPVETVLFSAKRKGRPVRV
jgi:hypothetical protein